MGSDDFCNGLLPRWQFNHDPDPRYYHLDALQGTYTITTREVCTELTQAVNTLTQRMSYPSCAAEVTVDASQAVSHIEVNVEKCKMSFMAFSAHKMMGP
ncbi:Beta-xylosidase, partial [human gut metagenome]